MTSLKSRKCEYCLKTVTTPCEVERNTERCSNYVNTRNNGRQSRSTTITTPPTAKVSCPACRGGSYLKENKKCALCRGNTWVTKAQADRFKNQ